MIWIYCFARPQTWDAASDEDAMKLEKMLAEKK